ncbi:MAG TPA: tRNA epoxyqueuosine(34) reductase QueG [Nitrospiraceae bacterium]|nr:tRNA epoxyqueuosine(34) reductase QueG [Nitrospiraceae bacterium]
MLLAEAIKQEARAIGFDVVGISRILSNPPVSHPDSLYSRLSEWLRRGYQGAMEWMAREPSRRADPQAVLAGCRSVISVGMNYYSDQRADERPGHGRIARYAWGKDYHDVLQARLGQLEDRIGILAPGAGTRSYVDTGPVMEKAWAQQAGLGWIGKHSNLVSTRFGSWLVLGEVLTTLELEPDEPATDLCGSCSLCIKACPTGAITEPYVVDARRCISYLTIELHKPGDEIPADLAPKLGNRIFGCDDCLDVCPYNIHALPATEPEFQPAPLSLAPDLEQLAGMDAHTFASTFRKSPLKRARHTGFLRNVRLAIKNAAAQIR